MRFILASSSPRRQQMFRDLGLTFEVIPADIDEKSARGETPLAFARRLAREKARAAVRRVGFSGPDLDGLRFENDWAVLAADTIVVLEKHVLGKPRDASDGLRMLKRLSGRSHSVVTAWAWIGRRSGWMRETCGNARTIVTFASRPVSFWKWYLSTGEPMDKAGAYAAQGIGMSFIERVRGSYSNVVGLPLSKVLENFRAEFGKDLSELCRQRH